MIQRDRNSVNNMKKLVNQYLEDKTRPEKYRRSYKFTVQETKGLNPRSECQIRPCLLKQVHLGQSSKK